jgi:site-specific DNA-methyltransferase (adenine-specific)
MPNVDLRCGDCLEGMKGIPDGSVDAVITDPPYGIGFKYNTHDDDPEAYADFMRVWITEAQRAVGNGAMFVWQAMLNAPRWHEWFPAQYRIFAACKSFVQYRPTSIQFSWDPVIFWGELKTDPSVYSKDYHEQLKAPFGKNREHIEHPCPRPLEQVQYVLEVATRQGATILDPFMGSGTTGVACVKTGRNFIGFELDPQYFAIAEKRIHDALAQQTLDLSA